MTIKELAQKKSKAYDDNDYCKGCYYDGFMDGIDYLMNVVEDLVSQGNYACTEEFMNNLKQKINYGKYGKCGLCY